MNEENSSQKKLCIECGNSFDHLSVRARHLCSDCVDRIENFQQLYFGLDSDWKKQEWIINLQIENQHLKYHTTERFKCFSDKNAVCFPDLRFIICPRCYSNNFKGYNQTDENDTYIGFSCENCNFDYSLSH